MATFFAYFCCLFFYRGKYKSCRNILVALHFLLKYHSVRLRPATTIHTYTSPEPSAKKAELCLFKLTIFNIYRPPTSSMSNNFPRFLKSFTASCILLLYTAPHAFLITGDLNLHVDDPLNSQAIAFLSLTLFSFCLSCLLLILQY